MARTKAYLAPLNVGEISRTALARVDIQRVQGAAALCSNLIPMVEGALKFRPGTVYTGHRTLLDRKCRMIPFPISSDETAMLELTDQAMRVFVGDQPVTRLPVATTWANPGITGSLAPWVPTFDTGGNITVDPGGGAVMVSTKLGTCRLTRTQAIASVGVEHGIRIKVELHPVRVRCGTTTTNDDIIPQTTLNPGVHSIACIPTAATIYFTVDALDVGVTVLRQFFLESPGAMQVPTPWTEAQLSSIRVDQSADVMFAGSGTTLQRRIERRSMSSWSVAEYQTDDGPFTSERPSKVYMKPSALIGNVTLTASAPIFSLANLFQLMEIYHGSQSSSEYLYREGHATPPVKITGYGAQRNFSFTISGLSGMGTRVTLTRSAEKFGKYNDYSAGTLSYTTDGTISPPADGLDGRDLYYRLEILKGNYSSGSPLIDLKTASGSQRGIVRILSVLGATQVVAEAISPLGDTGETDDWRFGDWSTLRGWPSAVAIHDGRLFWKRRDGWFGSVSDDFSGFDQETTGDSGPIIRRAGTGLVEGSHWLLSLQRLIDGGPAGVRSIRSSSFDAPLTPTNFLIRDIDSRGSAPLSPVKIDSTAIYVSRDYKRALEIAYNVDINDYAVKNLTRLSRDIFRGVTVTGIAAQRHPDTRIWFVCSDGTARILAYDKEEEVAAWYRWSTDGFLEEVCPRPTAKGSVMYAVVRRSFDNGFARFIERVALDAEAVGEALSITSDCSVIYDGVPATTIGNGTHLANKKVVVWADGEVIADADAPLTVSPYGTIALPAAKSKVVYGLAYEGRWKGSKLAFGGQMGTSVSQRKQANAASLLLVDTAIGGIRIGGSFKAEDMGRLEDTVRGSQINRRAVVDEYDIDPQTFPTWAGPDSRVHILFKAPYPATVAGAMIDVLTHES